MTAAVLATAGAGLVLAWMRRRRPAPVPVVRCPIHGIAYDAELEMCPDCAKTQPTREPDTRPQLLDTRTEPMDTRTQPIEKTGGTR